ncbi:ABC transporter permease [Rothia sp. P5764]|uniref:ABC transporter permease n=1 Tax=Rothia sp. P5764 TaxID=3402654 RepID=UPI003ACAEED1
MNIKESISLALGSLRNNKMRSFLTLLGIIMGIASVIAILTLGHSLQTQANQAVVSSGANDLNIQVKERPREDEGQTSANISSPYGMMGSSGQMPTGDSLISIDDINTLKEVMGDNIAGIPLGNSASYGAELTYEGQTNSESLINFVNMDYLELNPKNLVAGRAITQTDIDNKRPVIMISTDQLSLLGGDPVQAVGQEVEVSSGGSSTIYAVVVGVYQPDNTGGLLGMSGPGAVLMPYTFEGQFSSMNADGWSYLSVRPAEGKDLAQVKALLQAHLTNMYRSDEQFMAEIMDYSAATQSFNDVLAGISAAISAIAGISLLVGGIGVMNIMLVTVTERTREIGIRKALGATRGAIRLQFVVEAMIVCLVGGILGVLVGGGLGMLGSNMLGTFVLPPLSAVTLSLGFSLAIGLFFGYYPANKAAKLDPIDALRYE